MNTTPLTVGARVVVAIDDFDPWNKFVADAVQGKMGTIVEIKEVYNFPSNPSLALPGYLVEFDETLLKDDGRQFKAFWFLPCDISLQPDTNRASVQS